MGQFARLICKECRKRSGQMHLNLHLSKTGQNLEQIILVPPARRRLPLISRLRVFSCLSKFRAMHRSSAKFSSPWTVRTAVQIHPPRLSYACRVVTGSRRAFSFQPRLKRQSRLMFPLSARYRHDKLICLLERCEWNRPPEVYHV